MNLITVHIHQSDCECSIGLLLTEVVLLSSWSFLALNWRCSIIRSNLRCPKCAACSWALSSSRSNITVRLRFGFKFTLRLLFNGAPKFSTLLNISTLSSVIFTSLTTSLSKMQLSRNRIQRTQVDKICASCAKKCELKTYCLLEEYCWDVLCLQLPLTAWCQRYPK